LLCDQLATWGSEPDRFFEEHRQTFLHDDRFRVPAKIMTFPPVGLKKGIELET
jgi:hypothetical protein